MSLPSQMTGGTEGVRRRKKKTPMTIHINLKTDKEDLSDPTEYIPPKKLPKSPKRKRKSPLTTTNQYYIPEQTRSIPDPYRSGPDSIKTGPEQYKGSPDRYRGSPDRYRCSPDRYRSSFERYKGGPDSYRGNPDLNRINELRSPGDASRSTNRNNKRSPIRSKDNPDRFRGSPDRCRSSSDRYRVPERIKTGDVCREPDRLTQNPDRSRGGIERKSAPSRKSCDRNSTRNLYDGYSGSHSPNNSLTDEHNMSLHERIDKSDSIDDEILTIMNSRFTHSGVSKNESYMGKLQSLAVENVMLKSDLDVANREIAQLRCTLRSTTDEKPVIEALQEELFQKEQKLSTLEKEWKEKIKKLEDEIINLKKVKIFYEERIRSLELESVKESDEPTEDTNILREEIEDLKKQRDNLENDKAFLMEDCESLKEKIRELDLRSATAEKLFSALREALKDERKEKKKAEKLCVSLRKELLTAQEESGEELGLIWKSLRERENDLKQALEVLNRPKSYAYTETERVVMEEVGTIIQGLLTNAIVQTQEVWELLSNKSSMHVALSAVEIPLIRPIFAVHCYPVFFSFNLVSQQTFFIKTLSPAMENKRFSHLNKQLCSPTEKYCLSKSRVICRYRAFQVVRAEDFHDPNFTSYQFRKYSQSDDEAHRNNENL